MAALTVRMSPDELMVLDGLARVYGSRSAAIRALIRSAASQQGTPDTGEWKRSLDTLRDLLESVSQEVAILRAQVENLRAGQPVAETPRNLDEDMERAAEATLDALLSFEKFPSNREEIDGGGCG